MSRSEVEREHSERAVAWRFFWLAVGIVVVQRGMLAVHDVLGLRRSHAPVSLYELFVHGYAHWDGTWYVLLADSGYTRLKDTAFWPLYPWAIRGLHTLTHLTYATCGIIISLISFVFALFFLGLLARREFSWKTAVTAMLLFAFFPTAYYFDAVYTEAMFMAFCLGAVYFSNRHRFFLAGSFAALATLTRNTGILLLVILAFDYVRYRDLDWRFWRVTWWRRLNPAALGLLIPPGILALYCVWLKLRFGRFLAFMQAERFWHRSFMWPWMSFRHTVGQWLKPDAAMMEHVYVGFEAACFVVAVVMLLLGLRYIRKSLTQSGWWLYMLIVVWITSSQPAMNLPDYLLSFPRFVLMLFPGFVYIAEGVRPRWLVWPVLGIFTLYLLSKSGQFFHHAWIA